MDVLLTLQSCNAKLYSIYAINTKGNHGAAKMDS
jgi:hypothetical protein